MQQLNRIFKMFRRGESTISYPNWASRISLAFSVSRIGGDLDEKVDESLKRPIEQAIPYLLCNNQS